MRIKGFTLIEMIITIVVIIVLSSISVPMYKGYKRQAIAAEAYVLLGAIRDAQKIYFQKHKRFLYCVSSYGAQSTSNDEVLGIDARGNKYFTWFCISNHGNNYYFDAFVEKPKILGVGPNNYRIALQYNITLGQRFCDFPIDRDTSWETM